MKHVEAVVRAVLDNQAWKATKFVSDKLVVRATQKLYRHQARKARGSRETAEIILTIGRPNYAERKFLASCARAGEPVPVRKIQLKFPPKRRT